MIQFSKRQLVKFVLRFLLPINIMTCLCLLTMWGTTTEMTSTSGLFLFNAPGFLPVTAPKTEKLLRPQERPQPQSKPDNNNSNNNHQTDIIIHPCTPEQKATVEYQLPPDTCINSHRMPWRQRCSFSYATACPDAVWLTDYYKDLVVLAQQQQHDNEQSELDATFLSLYVGCNKGIDAIGALRMGSFNPNIQRDLWTKTLFGNMSQEEVRHGVCAQEFDQEFPISPSSSPRPRRRKAEVHCIEPMPKTANGLKRSVQQLGWQQELFVQQAAIGRHNKQGLVPSEGAQMGVENLGIKNFEVFCASNSTTKHLCEPLLTYDLDTYVDKFVKSDGPIHLLSVDVEGFDMDVLLGAPNVLRRTHYLEFEYNWMGSWAKQKLSDAISMLRDQYGLVCYWPGVNGRIWRITDCWLDHYQIHMWSNVACVNHRISEVKPMADHMEQLFLSTLQQGRRIRYDRPQRRSYMYTRRKNRHDEHANITDQ